MFFMGCVNAVFDSTEKGSKAGLAEQVVLSFREKLQPSYSLSNKLFQTLWGTLQVFFHSLSV